MLYLAFFLQQTQPDPAAIKGIIMAMAIILPIVILVAIVIVMVPCWFILKKAGFSPWLSLLCIMPSLGTLVLLYVLAFSEWKVVPALTAAYPPQPQYPPLPPQA
jgi:heme/copper-type cytochrome/quinol oxidase subunit 2